MDKQNNAPAFTKLIDLASERYGGQVLEASDEFFAEKEGLIKATEPLFRPDEFTERGKWMDGWETRRRRSSGHDWCVIQLAFGGSIEGVDVDTSHFIGNHPPEISVEATRTRDREEFEWQEIIPKTRIEENAHNYLPVASEDCWTSVRLNIFPDGGVARFRIYGSVVPDWSATNEPGGEVELSAVRNGGRVVSFSDEHFGRAGNLLLPDAPMNMGDGWETKRRRGPGHDWVILQLGSDGTLNKIELDTTHFKGNYPDRISIEGCMVYNESSPGTNKWEEVLTEQSLQPDFSHSFEEFSASGPFSHIRLNIIPDGGVARVRVFGRRHGV